MLNCIQTTSRLLKNIIYQATVTEKVSKKTETYLGLTSTTFKERLNNHNTSFRHEAKETHCELSKHIWRLKRQNIEWEPIKWKIISRAKPYSPITGKCNLCIKEKCLIVFKSHLGTLNKRLELTTDCRHRSNQLLIPKKEREI